MFHTKHEQSSEIVTDIFTQTTLLYNFRQNRGSRLPSENTVYNGSENISYFRPKILEVVPVKIRETNSLNSFKKEIRKWVPQNCLCICYIENIYFIILLLDLNDVYIFALIF